MKERWAGYELQMVLFCSMITACLGQRQYKTAGMSRCVLSASIPHSFKIKNKSCGAFITSGEWAPREVMCDRAARSAALFLLQQSSLKKNRANVCEGAEERDWASGVINFSLIPEMISIHTPPVWERSVGRLWWGKKTPQKTEAHACT